VASPPVGEAGVAVPAVAVRHSQDGHAEVVVCKRAEDKVVAEVRQVEVGGRAGATTILLSGLAVDEMVVVDHVLGIEDGAALEATTAGAAAAAPAPAGSPPVAPPAPPAASPAPPPARPPAAPSPGGPR
jgi:hypothetical protein